MKNTAGEVAVFWDYENCPAPTNTSGYAVVNNIRSIAQTFGSVKLFKAYTEVTEQVLLSKAVVLRSELQSSGVSLTDCPHNGRKDVADKMILVDMLAHVIDNPAPSTIVLISGDRDFAYALSTLRLRCYRIVLITLPNAHQSLRAQASLCFDWVSDVLERVDPFLTQQLSESSPRRAKTSTSPAHAKFYSDSKDHDPSRTPWPKPCDEKSASNVDYFQDEMAFPKHDARHDFFPPNLEHPKRQTTASQTTASSVTSDTLSSEPDSPARVTHFPVASSCNTDFNDRIDTPTPMTACDSNFFRTTLVPNISAGSTSNPTINESIMASTTSAYNSLEFAKPPNLIAQHDAQSSVSIESTMQILRAEAALRESFQQQDVHPSINADKTQGLPSIHQIDPDIPLPRVHSGMSPPASVATPLSASALSSTLPSSPRNAIASDVTRSPVKAANPPQSASPSAVLEKFKILIKCLKSHRSRGLLHPHFSKILLEIAHTGTIYRLPADFSGFGEYIAMAEKAGVVELGGSGSRWIALKAPWYNARLS